MISPNDYDYKKWLDSVDEYIQEIYGEGKETLPKIINFRSMFTQSYEPQRAAEEALRLCGLNSEEFEGIFVD